jgi:lysyl-tRNA synthetase class 2
MWQPSASLLLLKKRAEFFNQIRDFFRKRQVLEVDTPLLCHTSIPDIHIQSIPAAIQLPNGRIQNYYLQTSPEFAMKRLLAAHGQAIFQLGKAFRQEEIGRYHQPEFTMLEWYRPGFDHHALMDEVDALLQNILNTQPAVRITYDQLFFSYLNIHPHISSLDELKNCAEVHSLLVGGDMVDTDKDTWLNLLLTHCIEPHLGQDLQPCFVYDFPASQAALSRVRSGEPKLASRFEVYLCGVELANGFHELQDADEQRQRFLENLQERERLGLPILPIDEYLLAALEHGLPDCAGVALGVDRLIMAATGAKHIQDVVSFDFSRV